VLVAIIEKDHYFFLAQALWQISLNLTLIKDIGMYGVLTQFIIQTNKCTHTHTHTHIHTHTHTNIYINNILYIVS